MSAWIKEIEELEIGGIKPCRTAINWLLRRSNADSLEEAWRSCLHPDWMAWYAQAIKADLEALAGHLGVTLLDEDLADEYLWQQLVRGNRTADDIRAFWPTPPLPKLQSESLSAHTSMLSDSKRSTDE